MSKKESNNNKNFKEGKVFVGTEEIIYDQGIMVKEEVVYLPLRQTLEALGFKVIFNKEDKVIDVMKEARFTKLYINCNDYIKNGMASIKLSGPPFVENGRTLVPIEFFYVILSESFEIKNNNIHFNSELMGAHSGFIQKITIDKEGEGRIVISSKEVSEERHDQTYIHVNTKFTIVQKCIREGDFVHILTSPVMTRSMPGQTGGFVIY